MDNNIVRTQKVKKGCASSQMTHRRNPNYKPLSVLQTNKYQSVQNTSKITNKSILGDSSIGENKENIYNSKMNDNIFKVFDSTKIDFKLDCISSRNDSNCETNKSDSKQVTGKYESKCNWIKIINNESNYSSDRSTSKNVKENNYPHKRTIEAELHINNKKYKTEQKKSDDSVEFLFDGAFSFMDDTQMLLDKNLIETYEKQITSNLKEFTEDNSFNLKSCKTDEVSMVKVNSTTVTSTVLTPAVVDKNTEEMMLDCFIKEEKCTDDHIFVSLASTQTINVDRHIKNEDCKNSVSDIEIPNLFDRKEIELVFDKAESLIYELGSNKDSSLCDILMKNTSIASQSLNECFENTNWFDSTEFTDAIAQMPIKNTTTVCDVIKQALLENVSRHSEVKRMVNSTIIESTASFTQLGPFYDLPSIVQELLKQYRGISNLYEWQKECLSLPSIQSRKNLIYALPTSGGKTLVAEILMLRELLCRRRNAIFILPFVAIVQEKVWALSPFAVALDFLVEEYASTKGTYPPRKRRRKNSIYVATIEKALGLVNSLYETGRINELGLVVIDELHLIGEQGRGTTLEALLTKLMYINENIHIVGMSATIGNLDEICMFLEAEKYVQNFRPVELVEYVKCGNEIAKINRDFSDENELLTVIRKAEFSYSEAISNIDPDRLGGLVMEIVPSGSCLIFCASKKNCENVSILLCKVLYKSLLNYKKTEKEHLKESLKNESGTLCNILNVSVPFGVAYHHSGLTNEERKLIEDGFKAGILSVICCTSTLAAGVNLPAQRVILRQPYIGRDFINLSRYKQMVGRAGRAGLGEIGESILICNYSDLPKVKSMLMSPMDQAVSGMHKSGAAGLRHLLLSCISLGIANTRFKLREVTAKTLMAVQQNHLDVNCKRLTDKIICELFKCSAVKLSHKNEDNNISIINNISVQMDTTSSNAEPIPSSSNSLESTLSSDSKSVVFSSSSGRSEASTKLLTFKQTPVKKSKIMITSHDLLEVSKLGSAAIKGRLGLDRAHILYTDLKEAQGKLVLLNALHLIYLVTPYDLTDQIKPDMRLYYDVLSKLDAKHLKTANALGINEACAFKMLTNKPIKTPPARVINRFYLALMLHDLWNGSSVFQIAEKYQVYVIDRGLVQNLLTQSASFATNVISFCEELEEFWPFVHLLKGLSQKLSQCHMKDIQPLMELPAVKQNRARQLYNAGFKTLQSIAKADPNDLMETIDYMPRRVATQLIAAAKMLLLEKIENLREEAEDVMDGIDSPKVFLNKAVTS